MMQQWPDSESDNSVNCPEMRATLFKSVATLFNSVNNSEYTKQHCTPPPQMIPKCIYFRQAK